MKQLFHTTVHLKNQIQVKEKKYNLPADQVIVRHVCIYTMKFIKKNIIKNCAFSYNKKIKKYF
jgi:hypothetical protein